VTVLDGGYERLYLLTSGDYDEEELNELHTILSAQDLVIETLRPCSLSLSTFDGRVNCGVNLGSILQRNLPAVAVVAELRRSLKGKIVVVVWRRSRSCPGLSPSCGPFS